MRSRYSGGPRLYPPRRPPPCSLSVLIPLALAGRARGAAGVRRRPGHPGHLSSPPPPAAGAAVEAAHARRCSSATARTGASARRPLVLPPGRPFWRQRSPGWYAQRDLSGWSADPGPPQLERHRPDAEPPDLGLVPQGVQAAADPKDVNRAWKVRFEGSNYRTTVWLNGRKIGGFTGLLPVRAGPRRASGRAATASWCACPRCAPAPT